ncbi:hypothetical protein BT63DRAFT_453988 [Microthyrium microscopicum]|uniref:Uncharacterized protein n=1 Tax=Microthyrium microscopicum TaxID=703497 RepID=A0A6A6UC23_9PEZI|nr:hypothetical protein BT63DRAFT_453988 [Microthyrium microscopicum]
MRTSSLYLLACAETVLSASLGESINFEKRQLGGLIGGLTNAGYGKVADPPGHAPRKEELKSPMSIPGVTIKRVKIRAGPYKVPDMGTKSVTGHSGMLESYYDPTVQKPCDGDCSILQQVGGLEYTNGTNANIDTGMWLHHMVHFNTGARRWDPVGRDWTICLPHLGFGSSPSRSERYFVTGNERTPFHYYREADKTAYHLDPADKFTYLVELMNMNMAPQTVYVTMTYDIIEGALPTGWKEIKTVFLDADSCRTSEVRPPKEKGSFDISSKPWKPSVEGKIIDAIGHLHDGGVGLDIKATTSGPFCSFDAKYSEKPEYVFRGMDMKGDKTAKDHISSMAGCSTPQDYKVPMMSKSQSWTIKGSYDYDKKEGNLEGGKQSEVMAIAILLVAVPPGPLKPV